VWPRAAGHGLTATPPLGEDALYWRARASDGQVSGPWSAPQLFRVNAIADLPHGAGAGGAAGRCGARPGAPALSANATSPDSLVLTYNVRAYVVGPNGDLVRVDGATGVAEGPGTTSFTWPDLADGSYRWRPRFDLTQTARG
jgi:hypothetical protein